MTVSVTWWEICSYPLLWKSLYFEEGWTVADEVIAVFEHRLYRLQQQLDFQYHRLRSAQYGMDEYRIGGSPRSDSGEIDSSRGSAQQHPPMSFEKSRLYDELFFELDLLLNGSKTYSALRDIQSQFSVIAGLEIGEPFSNSAMFIPNSNGTIRLHIDWRYLYANRSLLENNWRAGRYQARLLDGAPDVVPPAQREGVYCVYFDRKLLAAGSRDNSIRLWDMDNLTYRGSLKAHSGSVLCLQFDSQRNILISGSSDATIKIWNLESGEVVQTLEGHKESVLGLHTDDKYIVSCSRDCTARIWSCVEDSEEEDPSYVNAMDCADPRRKPIPKYVLLHVLKGHRAAVNSVHFIDDLIATASGDRTIRIWNLRKGLCIRTIHAHGRGIACVNIAGDLVVTGSSDHVIKIFNIANGLEVRTLRGHNGLVRTIQTDNTKIISGSYDQSIRIWDLKTGKMLQELGRCHDSKYNLYMLFLLIRVGYLGSTATNGDSYRVAVMRKSSFGISQDHPIPMTVPPLDEM
jgi:WD40 repeat protein